MRTRGLTAVSAVLATGMLMTGAGGTAAATVKEATLLSSTSPRVAAGICSAPAARKAFAAQLSGGIRAALRGRSGEQAVTVYDAVTGVSCAVNDGSRRAMAGTSTASARSPAMAGTT